MSQELRYILAMSCIIPGIVGLCLYRRMQVQYHLLVYMMLGDALTETIVFIGEKYTPFGQFSDLWSNAYIIISLMLFLGFVNSNGYIKKQLLRLLLAVAVLLAICIFFKVAPFFKNYYLLLCFMYATMLFISIDILSKQVMVINTRLIHNFWFWVSCLFIMQTAYGLLTFGIYLFSLAETPYGKNIGFLHLYVNVTYYCLFSIVLLYVPKRKSSWVNKNIEYNDA